MTRGRSVVVMALVLATACSVGPSQLGKPATPTRTLPTYDVVGGIIRAYESHSVVLLGDVHGSAELHMFLRTLVALPQFAGAVDDVVLEATNVRYQPILDRYIAGDSVPRDSLRMVWRNTTQLLLWDSPLYEELVETIRAVNAKRSGGHKLRVLASDPPIDWTAVKSAADFPRSYGYRDWQTTEVIEREVLAKQRHAFVLIGNAHIGRTGPRIDSAPVPAERESLGEALGRKHPGAAYVIQTVVGKGTPELEATVRAMAQAPALIPTFGTPLETQNSSLLFGKNLTLFKTVDGRRVPVQVDPARMPPLRAVIDAVLYLGPYSHDVLPDPAIYLDNPAYLAELRRRIAILAQVYGGDFWTDDLEAVIRSHH